MSDETGAPEVPGRIDPDELRTLRIPRAMRGYSRRAVDTLREHLAAAIEQLQSQTEDLRGQLESAVADRDHLRDEVERAARARKELADAIVEVTGEREALVSSFDDASREREKLLESFEQMTRERQDLYGRIRGLEEELSRARELERNLSSALVAAQRRGDEIVAQAEREAQLIVSEAQADARKLVLEIEREILATNTQLRSVLEKFESLTPEREPY